MMKQLQPHVYPTISEMTDEVREISAIGLPMIAMGLLHYLRSMVQVMCMGRLGSLELAGGSLAVGFTNITGYSLLSGLAMGMDPICSQAFGSKNISLASLTLRRTIFMLLVTSIPIASLWLSLQPLMLLLRQNPSITRVAATYCRFALPDLLANSLLQPIRIYFRSRGIIWPLMWTSFLSTLLNIPIAFSLTFSPLSLGVPGVAVSSFLTNYISLFFLLIYIYCIRGDVSTGNENDLVSTPLLIERNISPTGFFNYNAWRVLLRLSVPSCIGVCLEWWWYEFMTVVAGYLPNPQTALATAAIVIQTTSLMYTMPTALAASASTRVGNELGAGRPKKARQAAFTSMVVAVLASLAGLAWTTLGPKKWAGVFTDDPDVVKLTVTVLPIIGACEVANCPQTTSCGVLRGSARPRVAAAINFYSFYVIGAPIALLLAFVSKIGFLGLCYGLLAAQLACVTSIVSVVYRTDWEKESMKAQEMVGNSGCAHSLC